MKVARVGTGIGGALLAMCCLNFDAVAFESAPSQVPSSAPTSSVLPEFFDSSRLPDLRDAWHTSTRSGDRSGDDGAALPETPVANDGANPAGAQPVRRRAEELSGRFSDGASAGNLAGKSDAKPADAAGTSSTSSKEPPTSLSEAAMPAGTSVMSHIGAAPPVPPAADDAMAPAAPPVPPPADDITMTATLPDVATDKQPPADTEPGNATNNPTWLKVGLPPLPVRSPSSAKAHAKAVGAKSKGTTAKATEKSSGAKSTAGKVAAAKAPDKDPGKDDDEDRPVRQFRAPVVTHATPAPPRLDPGRKEVFPPYLGAFGWQSK